MRAIGPVEHPPRLEIGADEILAVACVRNELLRLPWFLEYHRGIGIDRFLIIDNGSDDGTTEYLRSQEDVAVFAAPGSYAEADCGVKWQNEVLDSYARDHWVLILDADEQFVYPRCEELGLRALTRYLEASGAQAVVAPLLDMYPRGPIASAGYVPGTPFVESCPFFDAKSYRLATRGKRPRVKAGAGPRQRLFWAEFYRTCAPPMLEKTPFVRWRDGLNLFASTHYVDNVDFAHVTGALLHFKFLQDFAERVRLEAERKEHYQAAQEYVVYREVVRARPLLSAYFDGSARYKDSLQLVRMGLMNMPADFPERKPRLRWWQRIRRAIPTVWPVSAKRGTPAGATGSQSGGYWDEFTVVEEGLEYLGGNLRHGDTRSITPTLWRYLVDRFAIRSMLDIGSGEGHAGHAFHRMGVIAHGIEGLARNVRNAKHPAAIHDLVKGPYQYPCDLVYCVEVAEHIAAAHVDALLETLCNAPVVAMTHALPGQPGHHHVNNRPSGYWIEKMDERGYQLSLDNDWFRSLARIDHPESYFGQSGLVFLKRI